MENTYIRVENDHLTIRTDTGWLLWSSTIPELTHGANFGDVLEKAASALEDWKREQSR